jgi:tetratricopeptide (TPR) repeat protein
VSTSAISRPLVSELRLGRRLDGQAVSVWALVGALVLYLALNSGGYDLVVRNQVGLVVWWTVLVGAICGLLPRRAPSAWAWAALALLGGFLAWMMVAWAGSRSPGRSLDEVSRVACYLGVFVLALAVHRERESAVRHTIAALATAIVAVAVLALISRLRPGTFAGADETASFLPGTQGRLDWPLDYWNALGALMALGLPLLLGLATTARRLLVQALAAASVPPLALCLYLTFSRGSALAAGLALLTFYALTDERPQRLATGLATAAASAVAIAGAAHRSAIENGATGSLASHQGARELLVLVIAAAAAGLLQAGIGLAARHGTLPRALRPSRARARTITAAALGALIVLALAAGAVGRLNRAWQDFKRPTAASLHQNSLARFGSASGNQRYDYWKVAVQASSGHLLTGTGPGTFEFVWLSRAPYSSPVRNAHSLFFETLLEDGIPGLALVLAFLLAITGAAVRVALRGAGVLRTHGAAIAGACLAFLVSVAVDWTWQMPVLPVAFGLLGAAVLAPAASRRSDGATRPRRRRGLAIAGRGLLSAVAIASLGLIAVPLAATASIQASQSAARAADTATALGDAQTAVRVQPGTAEPELQLALVDELRGQIPAAVQAIRRATADDPLDWSTWLVRSRLEAENGDAGAALTAFERARSLNPHASVFLR